MDQPSWMYQTPSLSAGPQQSPAAQPTQSVMPSPQPSWGTPDWLNGTTDQVQRSEGWPTSAQTSTPTSWGDAFKTYAQQNDAGYQALQRQMDEASKSWSNVYADPAFSEANNRQNTMMQNWLKSDDPNKVSADALNRQMAALTAPWVKRYESGQATLDKIRGQQEEYFTKRYGDVYSQMGGLQQFAQKYGNDATPVVNTIAAMINKMYNFKTPWSIPK